ncbi:MAG: CapA family protein [Calditrichota bacterium]
MRACRLVFLLLILSLASAEAGRSVRSVTGDESNPSPDTLAVTSLRLYWEGEDAVISWDPLRYGNPDGGLALTGYLVFQGNLEETGILLVRTSECYFRHRHALAQAEAAYRVQAVFAGRPQNERRVHRIPRDMNMLVDFEDPNLELSSYSQAEDRSPNAWGITNIEALPGDGERSLRLSGNTWKRMAFPRTDLTDSTVWSIGVMCVEGDTMGETAAFGLSDGASELFYTFHGKRTIWQEPWVISRQDIHALGAWHIYRLPVGYDWNIRYGYLPTVNQLFFVNDNDNTNPPAQAYFDELCDLTMDIGPEPRPKFRWRIRQDIEAPGTPVEFLSIVDNREDDLAYLWEFGDGMTSAESNPLHIYRIEGQWTVGLTVLSGDGLAGRKTDVVEIGDLRQPVSLLAAWTGDIMLARRYEDVGGLIRMFGPEYVFRKIKTAMQAADLLTVNLECPLTDEGRPHATKDITFRGRPENVAGLAYLGVDIATLANNHATDYGQRGLEETTQVLDAAGIRHCGAGMDEYKALQPVFKTVNGIRVGVLAFCNRTGRDYNARPFLDAGYDTYGYAYFSGDNLLRSVPPAVDQCDLLAIAVHGGQEYDLAPMAFEPDAAYPPDSDERRLFSVHVDSATRELEHFAIDLGAGLIISHHPHVLQGLEVYDGVLIAHSLGNFAFDQNFWETWASAAVWTEITREGVTRAWIEPVFVDNYRPTPAVGNLGRSIIDRLAAYSRDLNAVVVPEYHNYRGYIALHPEQIQRAEREYSASGQMRFLENEGVYRSEPIRLKGGGCPSRILRIQPEAQEADWEISLGREILMVGGMENEGAAVWNYNSATEGRDSVVVHRGRYSSFLTRRQRQNDGITDLIQRIPATPDDRLTLAGWLRITNGNNAGLLARYYQFRYNEQPQFGDQAVESRLQGDHNWTYLWDQLVIPEGTGFLNVRWQLFGANQGDNRIWADDVELIRWDNFQPFEGDFTLEIPGDWYYLQVQTRRPVDSVSVDYRTVTLSLP